MNSGRQSKPLFWVGSSRQDLREFPDEVKAVTGQALLVAQFGGRHPDAKPLHGFGGAAVLEVVENFAGDTDHAVYTVRFAGAVFVLHAFQKKSKRGTKTPQRDIELVMVRLKRAEQEYADWTKSRA